MATPIYPVGAAIPANAIAITPSDTVVYNPPLLGIHVNGGGSLVVLPVSQVNAVSPTAVTYSALPSNFVLALQISQVLAATSATGLIGYRAA
jgi:hypothetical protein